MAEGDSAVTRHRGDRGAGGEVSLAIALAGAALVAFVMAGGALINYAFSEDTGGGSQTATVSIDDTIFSNPPGCKEAGALAAKSYGLVYGPKGWRLAGNDGPQYEGGNVNEFNRRFRNYRGVVLAQVNSEELQKTLTDECNRQKDLGAPAPTSSTIARELPPEVPGTYRYEHEQEGSTVAGECQDSITTLRVGLSGDGTTISITSTSPVENLIFTGTITDYAFRATASTADGIEIGKITGRFARFGDDTLIRDGTREVEVGGGCTFRYGATRTGS